MNHVGYEEATNLGFTLQSFSGDKSWAIYVNDIGIFLEVRYQGNSKDQLDDPKLECQLSFMHKLLTVRTNWLSFPNKNFHIFYTQIRTAYNMLGD